MTTNAIKVLREAESKATKGPWTTDVYFIVANFPGCRPTGEVIIRCEPTAGSLRDKVPMTKNADFIALSHNAMPALLDLLEKQAEEIAVHRRWDAENGYSYNKNWEASGKATDAALARLEQSVGEVGNG